jgi:hypothetical protein
VPRHAWLQGLAAAREEAFLMCGLWLAALAVAHIPQVDGDSTGLLGSPDLTVWVAVLLIQSVPYAAAVVVSIVACLNLPGGWIGEAGRQPAAPSTEPSTMPGPAAAADNGGALPVTAKLDSAR